MKAIVLVHGGAGAIPDSKVEFKYVGTKAAVKGQYRTFNSLSIPYFNTLP